MRYGWDDFWELLVCVVVPLLAIVFVIVYAFYDCRKQEECREHGGHVAKYNCRQTTHCTHSGSSTTCTTREECDWRCEGVPAEDPQ